MSGHSDAGRRPALTAQGRPVRLLRPDAVLPRPWPGPDRPAGADRLPAADRLRLVRERTDAEFEAHSLAMRSLLVELARCFVVAPPAAPPQRLAPPAPPERLATPAPPERLAPPQRLAPPARPERLAPAGALSRLEPSAPAGRGRRRRRSLGRAGRSVAVAGLVAAALLVVVFVRLSYVTSGSMRPSVPAGALVVSVAVPADMIDQGDVITFPQPGRRGTRMTHRVMAVQRRHGQAISFTTKGDANSAADDWRVPASGRVWRQVVVLRALGRTVAGLGRPVPRLVLELLPLYFGAGLFLAWVWRRPPSTFGAADEYF